MASVLPFVCETRIPFVRADEFAYEDYTGRHKLTHAAPQSDSRESRAVATVYATQVATGTFMRFDCAASIVTGARHKTSGYVCMGHPVRLCTLSDNTANDHHKLQYGEPAQFTSRHH